MDFGIDLAGPLVGLLLADQGAEVIKVDTLARAAEDCPVSRTLNRGKRVVRLDLATAEGLAEAKALAAQADVLVENFEPGFLASAGLDLQGLRAERPALVTVSLPGFASDDAEHAGLRAYDGVIGAAMGVFMDMGLDRILEGYVPCYSALPQASVYGAVLAATAAVAAVVKRQTTSIGDAIEVPLAAALLEGLCYNSMDLSMPERYYSNRALLVQQRLRDGMPMNMTREQVLTLQEAFFRLYRCGDGRSVYLVCMGHIGHVRRCLATMGVEEEVRSICPSGGDLYDSSTWKDGVNLEQFYLRDPYSSAIREVFERTFLERSAASWAESLSKAGVPCVEAMSTKEWLHTDHAIQSGLVVESEDILRPGPLVWLQPGAPEEVPDAKPFPTQDMPTAHPSPADANRAPAGGWLDGVRALCLCDVIAGPMVSATLARFGADVIQVTHPKPLYDPRVTVQFGLLGHRGKRSVLLDAKAPAGRDAFVRLVRWADVIVFNGSPDQVGPMGLDCAALQRTNPSAILCVLDLFGGPHERGPWQQRRGYDDLIQAAVGIMDRFGEPGQPTEHAHIGTIDVFCGWAGAFACVCALLQRLRSGRGGVCRTSLAAAGTYLQMPFAHEWPGKVFDEPRGKTRGANDLHRCVECSDGWIFVAAVPADPTAEERRVAEAALAANGFGDLSAACSGRQRAEVLGTLRAAGMTAVPCRTLSDWRDRTVTPYFFEDHPIHPCGQPVRHIGSCAVRAAEAQLPRLGPSRKLGSNTVGVLQELGLSSAQVEALLESGAASTQVSEHFVPK